MEQPYHFVESGLNNVYLVGITVRTCSDCKEDLPEIPNISRLHDKIAETIATKPAELTGEEIRFLRKNLGLKAEEFAKHLGTTSVSLSRWENGHDVSKENDKLIRYFYLRFKEEKTRNRINASVEELDNADKPSKPLNLNVQVRPSGVKAEFVEA